LCLISHFVEKSYYHYCYLVLNVEHLIFDYYSFYLHLSYFFWNLHLIDYLLNENYCYQLAFDQPVKLFHLTVYILMNLIEVVDRYYLDDCFCIFYS
jgi:hypothetical protein